MEAIHGKRVPLEFVVRDVYSMHGNLAKVCRAVEIGEWIGALRVVVGMRANRVGILGQYYGGMLDVYTQWVPKIVWCLSPVDSSKPEVVKGVLSGQLAQD